MSDDQFAIQLRKLNRYFGRKHVVRDLNLRVPKGQVTALLGLNGAGKTTTIRMLMGLLAPTRGHASVLGEDALAMSTGTRAKVGYLVEGHFLYPSMRVRDCQSFQRAGYPTWNDHLFVDIVDHFGIDRQAKVSTLSRGQRAGVALALVLAPDPELLVLDDPALGLDPVSRRALNETLVEFAGNGKRTVLLSTHLIDDVERIADRVAVMVGGRLKVDTSLDEFVGRVSMLSLPESSIDADQLASLTGLIEARRLGSGTTARWQLTLVDVDESATNQIERLSGTPPERMEATLNEAVLAYLVRERGDGSFFSKPLIAKANEEGATV
ncbi:MAG: ABC transporter ATP-binding protein [Planctomycetota bacterium]